MHAELYPRQMSSYVMQEWFFFILDIQDNVVYAYRLKK